MLKYPNEDKVTRKIISTGKNAVLKSHYIQRLSQIYLSSDLVLHNVIYENHIFNLYTFSSSDYAICPYCGTHNSRVHSKYIRTLMDLSILGKLAVLYIEVRKFFCTNKHCHKKTFAEQPGNEVFCYRRRTCRCERIVARHGISVSSSSACRLLGQMGISISSSTILRDLHRMKPSKHEDVTEIGVDDWTWRKGVRYGSIIVDYN